MKNFNNDNNSSNNNSNNSNNEYYWMFYYDDDSSILCCLPSADHGHPTITLRARHVKSAIRGFSKSEPNTR